MPSSALTPPESIERPESLESPESPGRKVKLTCANLWKVFGGQAAKHSGHQAMAAVPAPERRHALEEAGLIIAAEDVCFEVRAGELFVIMGLSGSGKSTVLRCIAQLQKPSFGDVFLDGTRLNTMPEAALREVRRRKMGMVFQNFGLVPHLTALANIAFPLKIRGEGAAEAMAKAEEMLNLVGLEGRGAAWPSQLSGGQQQRVGIARSLAVDPEVWLLDEPFSALDPLIRRQLQDELLALQSRLHKTVIFITHDFAEAVRLADRIAIMRDGRIVQCGSAADLLLTPADDYVRSFVQDVSRLKVLRLRDIIAPAKGGKSGGKGDKGKGGKDVEIAAETTLEDCLITLPSDTETICATASDGAVIGTCTRRHLLDIARGNGGESPGSGSESPGNGDGVGGGR